MLWASEEEVREMIGGREIADVRFSRRCRE
jgi:hypothetical protein